MLCLSFIAGMLKLVTLDVTGTLLKLKRPVGEMYATAGKCFGIEADPLQLRTCFKKNFEYLSAKHPNFGLTTGIGWELWWKCIVSMTFKCALNIPEDNTHYEKTLDLVGNHLIDTFSKSDGWRQAKGSVDFLNCLKNKGLYIGAISNFDPRLHCILEDIGIKNFFSFIITSYEHGVLKPDIKIFKNAELEYEKLTKSKFDGSFAIHVGDSVERDYLGAKRAGWNAILISSNTSNKTNDYLTFPNLIESKKYILKGL